MESYVQFLLELLRQFFGGFWTVIAGIFGGVLDVVNVVDYFAIFDKYSGGFNVLAWIIAIATILVLVAVLVGIIMFIVIYIYRRIRAREAMRNQMALVDEVGKLNAQVIRLTKEKDRILAIKAGAPDLPYMEGYANAAEGEEENSTAVKDGESRFYKLTHTKVKRERVGARDRECHPLAVAPRETCEQSKIGLASGGEI